MTYEEWVKSVERGVTINPEMAFAAGAASRDAEIAELKRDIEACPKGWHHSEVVALEKERDQLREQVKMLRNAIEFVNNRIGFSSTETYRQWEDIVEKALAATEQKP